MRALQQYMNTLEQRGKKGRRSADEDTPRRDESVRAAKAQRRSAAEAAKSRAAAGDDFDEGGGGGGGGGGARGGLGGRGEPVLQPAHDAGPGGH